MHKSSLLDVQCVSLNPRTTILDVRTIFLRLQTTFPYSKPFFPYSPTPFSYSQNIFRHPRIASLHPQSISAHGGAFPFRRDRLPNCDAAIASGLERKAASICRSAAKCLYSQRQEYALLAVRRHALTLRRYECDALSALANTGGQSKAHEPTT